MKFLQHTLLFLCIGNVSQAAEMNRKVMVSPEQVKHFYDLASRTSDPSKGIKITEEEEYEKHQVGELVDPQIFSVGGDYIVKATQSRGHGRREIEGSRFAQFRLKDSPYRDSFLFILSDGEIEDPDLDINVTFELMKKGPQSISEVWQNLLAFPDDESEILKKEEDTKTLFYSIGQVIAEMHRCGVRHGDLHLGNVLADPQNGKAFIIDWDSCVLYNSSLEYDNIVNPYWSDTNYFIAQVLRDFGESLGYYCYKIEHYNAKEKYIYSICRDACLSFIEGYLSIRPLAAWSSYILEKFSDLCPTLMARRIVWKELEGINDSTYNEFVETVIKDTLRIYDLIGKRINVKLDIHSDEYQEELTKLYSDRKNFENYLREANEGTISNLKRRIMRRRMRKNERKE